MRRVAEKWAPWVAGLVLVAGVASYTATRLVRSTPRPVAGPTTVAASVPLDPAARAVAREFVATAVARRDLGRAWQLAAPALRGHLTLAEWRTGNIPVQPYPVADATVGLTVKDSYPDSALLQLSFLPRAGSGAQPGEYALGLTRIAGHWRVASYAAASAIAAAGGP
jgi:hypothetical protein